MAIFGKASREGSDDMSAHIVIKGRWCLTEDGERVVPEGHPEGRWLWAVHGQEMPQAECEKLGYGRPAQNKMHRPQRNK